MKNLIKRYTLILAVSGLVLSSLACSALRVGVVDPTPEVPAVEGVVEESPLPPADVDGDAQESPEQGPAVITAVAWQGQIASMPEGSQYDDMVILNPEGTGEYGLLGATPEIEAEIRELRDGEGPQEFVHLWGSFSCGVDDVNGCQLVVDRLQSGAQMTEEGISGWTGTIQGFDFNMGPMYGFVLDGQVPMAYGIYASQDPGLQAEIERLRDTGSRVQVSGTLLVGFPDVNSTRIEVSSLQVVEEGSQAQPTQESIDPTADWQVFTSSRYGYQIRYPEGAELSFYGPEGFSPDDLPEGMTPDDYLDSLLKEYTDQLCVQIEYGLGFIYLSAPPNNQGELMVHCGVPGWGVGELIPQTRNISIGEDTYTVNGTKYIASEETNDGSLNSNILRMQIDLEDGLRIVYGSTPRTDATFEDFEMKTLDTLEQIVGTYRGLD